MPNLDAAITFNNRPQGGEHYLRRQRLSQQPHRDLAALESERERIFRIQDTSEPKLDSQTQLQLARLKEASDRELFLDKSAISSVQ